MENYKVWILLILFVIFIPVLELLIALIVKYASNDIEEKPEPQKPQPNTNDSETLANFMNVKWDLKWNKGYVLAYIGSPCTMNPTGEVWKESDYHSSWDSLIPIYQKVCHKIGLWMSTHEKIEYAKLWLEKSKEIERSLLYEKTPEKASKLIAQMIRWYNENS